MCRCVNEEQNIESLNLVHKLPRAVIHKSQGHHILHSPKIVWMATYCVPYTVLPNTIMPDDLTNKCANVIFKMLAGSYSIFAFCKLHVISASLFISIASRALMLWNIRLDHLSICQSFGWSVCKVYCGKTADWIRMPFGMVSGVSQRMGVLVGNGYHRRGRGSLDPFNHFATIHFANRQTDQPTDGRTTCQMVRHISASLV